MNLKQVLSLSLVATLVADTASAHELLTAEQAEARLRGCLLAGSSTAPQTGLLDAVVAVRSFCAPQIRQMQELRVADSTRDLNGQAAENARRSEIRKLNDEIAQAIANFTGLTQ